MEDAHSPRSGLSLREDLDSWSLPLIRHLGLLVAIAGVYFCIGKLGLHFAYIHPSVTAVWPSTGIALAALLVFGCRVWPAVFLGAFLVNATTSISLLTAVGIAAGNTLEGLAGAWLVNRWAGGRRAFDRARDIFKFTFLAGIVATAVSAAIGVTSLCLGGFERWAHFRPIAFTWWLGDAVGALVVAPVLVLWLNNQHIEWTRSRVFEALALFLALVAASQIVFGGFASLIVSDYPPELLFVPFLLWAAFRFHPRETAVFMLILPAAAIRGTLHGFGPFVRGTPHESLLLSQLLLGVTGIMTLAVSASVSERKRLEEMAAHLAAIVETSSDAIIGKTLEGVIVSWNRGAERIFGYSSAQAIGRPISILSPPGSAEELPRVLESLRRGENVQPYETIRCRKDGSLVNVSITVSPVCDARGRVTGYSAISRDITAHLQAERAMREANERLQASFSELERKTGEIALLNQMSHLLQSCQAEEEVWAVIRQYAARFFLGDSGAVYVLNAPANLLGAVAVWGEFPPEEQVFSMGDCWALRAGRVHSVSHPWAGMVCPHLARDPHPGSGVCVPMMAQGEALGLLHLKGLPALDQESPEHLPQRLDSREQLAVTAAAHIALALANLRLRETLRAQSIRDPLTGLFNRRYMMESLDRELRRAARSAQRLAAVILDIDLFKQFNDSYGHDAGDALLREVAALLQKGTRQEDFSCRHGGDEFVIIFTNISFAVAERRAREMRHAIRSLSIFHDGRYLRPPTVSLGAALYPDHAESAETLLRAADEALYRAKSSGRDRVVVGHTTESS